MVPSSCSPISKTASLLLESPQILSVCPSGKNIMMIKMTMKHQWNGTVRRKQTGIATATGYLILVGTLVGVQDFLFSIPIPTFPGAHPPSCKMSTTTLLCGYSSRGVALTTHPHLELRLRMSKGIPLLPLYECMACYEENFFTFTPWWFYVMYTPCYTSSDER